MSSPLKMDTNSLQARRNRHGRELTLNPVETEEECQKDFNFDMDLNGFSSIGTQTPTDTNSFEFPECFSPSLTMSRLSLSSSIGTQTDVRSRVSFQVTKSCARPKPKLFRRHSTGSDVYNFGTTSPTLLAFGGAPIPSTSAGNRVRGLGGGILGNKMMLEDYRGSPGSRQSAVFEDSQEDLESIGQQLRKIGDDLDRGGSFRCRSSSMSKYLISMRRGSSGSSSSSSAS